MPVPGIGLTFDLNAISSPSVLEAGVALEPDHTALGYRELGQDKGYPAAGT